MTIAEFRTWLSVLAAAGAIIPAGGTLADLAGAFGGDENAANQFIGLAMQLPGRGRKR